MFQLILTYLTKIYDFLESFWASNRNMRFIGSITVFSYLFSLLVIHLNIIGVFPESISKYIHNNYYDSITVAFAILLFFEVVSLVFTLPHSFSGSLLKQFEILSLILLRHAFDEFKFININLEFQNISESMYHMISNAFGAIIIFSGILILRNLQKHTSYTTSERDRNRFIQLKKTISLALIFIFSFLAIDDLTLILKGYDSFRFFKTFYTVLVFSDILLVLISLRYNHSYIIIFRNSGFAFATVLIRIALTSPVYVNAIIGIVAVLFTLILTFIYSKYNLKTEHN